MSDNSLRRLTMNTRLSAARIFDEESNDSVKSESKTTGKMKTLKKNVKKSPYKVNLAKRLVEYENDAGILKRRQKQIDYGKNTVGYDNYIKLVPKRERTLEHPRTPVKQLKYSRRGWDGLIKRWRQKLHEFDPDGVDADESESEEDAPGIKQERMDSDDDEDARMEFAVVKQEVKVEPDDGDDDGPNADVIDIKQESDYLSLKAFI